MFPSAGIWEFKLLSTVLNFLAIFLAVNSSLGITKMKLTNIVFGFAFAFITAVSTSNAGNLVTNGDFEANGADFVAFPGYISDGAPGNNPTAIAGWTGTGGIGINGPSGSGTPFGDANTWNATHYAFMQGEISIEQIIPGFVVDTEYTLSFDFNSRSGASYPIAEVYVNDTLIATSEAVTVDGLLPVQDNPTPGANPNDTPWYHADVPFTATTESITLKFQGNPSTLGGDYTWTVDNVVIENIPEPTSALLFLMGTATFLGTCRRKR